MKIVELITFLAGGGAERFVVDLSNQLSNDHNALPPSFLAALIVP